MAELPEQNDDLFNMENMYSNEDHDEYPIYDIDDDKQRKQNESYHVEKEERKQSKT